MQRVSEGVKWSELMRLDLCDRAVYKNGEVCISILHAGDDPTHYEKVRMPVTA
jgi:hypothetical protein